MFLSHFTDVETEVQKCFITCPSLHCSETQTRFCLMLSATALCSPQVSQWLMCGGWRLMSLERHWKETQQKEFLCKLSMNFLLLGLVS